VGAKQIVRDLFARADVSLNGDRPWDLRVSDERFYERVLAQSSLGFGDAFVDGWWECDRIDDMIARVLDHDLERDLRTDWGVRYQLVKAKLLNLQSTARAPEVAAHYDLGNDFFERVLGRTVMYSCAYWRDAADLDTAQDHKIELIARKLEVGAGDRVLDLGCGWGALSEHLARSRGCKVTAVTISAPQAEYVKQRCKGLPVEVLCCDYRADAVARKGPFDKIACVGMLEHVGRKNYRVFFEGAERVLAKEGLLLVHTIGTSVSTDVTDPWIERRIFPGSVLAGVTDIAHASERLVTLEDWHNFGADYDATLRGWYENFAAYAATGELKRDQRFQRTWKYYLLSFAGCFRTRRTIQLWQMVFSKKGRKGGYRSIREAV
jgi:cyclopropane-fatty-acyl-phospholipid synthase